MKLSAHILGHTLLTRMVRQGLGSCARRRGRQSSPRVVDISRGHLAWKAGQGKPSAQVRVALWPQQHPQAPLVYCGPSGRWWRVASLEVALHQEWVSHHPQEAEACGDEGPGRGAGRRERRDPPPPAVGPRESASARPRAAVRHQPPGPGEDVNSTPPVNWLVRNDQRPRQHETRSDAGSSSPPRSSPNSRHAALWGLRPRLSLSAELRFGVNSGATPLPLMRPQTRLPIA
jgi:hypothetical protein